MKDMVIDSCKWYVHEGLPDSEKSKVVEKIKQRYEPLLRFFRESGLMSVDRKDQKDWTNFEIKMSDFTEEGLELLALCHDRWLDAMDKGNNPANISIWRRELMKLRDEGIALH